MSVLIRCETAHVDLNITSATVFSVPYPLRRPFAASHQVVSLRDVVVVRVESDTSTGWAECPTLPDAGYVPGSTDSEFSALADVVLPALVSCRSVSPQRWAREHPVAGHSASVAAVEVALLDAQCAAQGISLARFLGSQALDVPAGAAVGLGAVHDVVAETAQLAAEGYPRIKVKIAPGTERQTLSAVRAEVGGGMEMQADANGAYDPADTHALVALEAVALTSLEQPFAPLDLDAHARLTGLTTTAVCLDESIAGAADIERAAAAGACRTVSLKWSRIGGVLETARLVRECTRLGLNVTIGGMLSSGLGRAVDLALAGLEGVDVTGDQSGSSRYADFDLTEPLIVRGGRIAVPQAPGLGVAVDVDRIISTATASITVRG